MRRRHPGPCLHPCPSLPAPVLVRRLEVISTATACKPGGRKANMEAIKSSVPFPTLLSTVSVYLRPDLDPVPNSGAPRQQAAAPRNYGHNLIIKVEELRDGRTEGPP
ncbi:unnamed protein product [Urochloa humidicola]